MDALRALDASVEWQPRASSPPRGAQTFSTVMNRTAHPSRRRLKGVEYHFLPFEGLEGDGPNGEVCVSTVFGHAASGSNGSFILTGDSRSYVTFSASDDYIHIDPRDHELRFDVVTSHPPHRRRGSAVVMVVICRSIARCRYRMLAAAALPLYTSSPCAPTVR